MLAGLIAAQVLPVAQYPEIAPPTVTITANYPGASAETLAEDGRRADRGAALGRREPDLLQLELVVQRRARRSPPPSRSAPTSTRRSFNVNNRVQIALPRLPDDVRRNGVVVQKRSTDILLVVALQLARRRATTRCSCRNYATVNVLDELKRVPGVADAHDLRRARLLDAHLAASRTDGAARRHHHRRRRRDPRAERAVRRRQDRRRSRRPPGQPLVYTVTARGRLIEPEEFGNIVLRSSGPAACCA